MTNKYLVNGNTVWLNTSVGKETDKIPVGTYVVSRTMEGTYFLTKTDDMTVPDKIYGPVVGNIKRAINTFDTRDKNLGILLHGEKGSGKTLYVKQMSASMRERGVSTILVNSPFCGDGFNLFIGALDEQCLIVFDEFEKVYDEKSSQSRLLTLLDGTITGKKMFVFTVNQRYGVSEYMFNRPGRLYYSYEYNGIDEDTIREYCDDMLEDKSQIESIVSIFRISHRGNMDMLVALVDEMNRYNETAKQVLYHINVELKSNTSRKYEVSALKIGEEVLADEWDEDDIKFGEGRNRAVSLNVFEDGYFNWYYTYQRKGKKKVTTSRSVSYNKDTEKTINSDGTIVMHMDDGFEYLLTPVQESNNNMHQYIY